MEFRMHISLSCVLTLRQRKTTDIATGNRDHSAIHQPQASRYIGHIFGLLIWRGDIGYFDALGKYYYVLCGVYNNVSLYNVANNLFIPLGCLDRPQQPSTDY